MRLFSVAASVGFAAQIGSQKWLVEGRLPNSQEQGPLSLLVCSIVVVVASWEGYFKVISRVKLRDAFRFYLDIFIVLLYIILLNSSLNQRTWHWTLVAIFLCYLIWDILTHVASERDWKGFRPHSFCWLLAFVGTALLVTCGPFHPFRYAATSLISVLLFRWILSRRKFAQLLALATSRGIISRGNVANRSALGTFVKHLALTNFVIHLALATILTVLCFAAQNCYVYKALP